MTQPKTNLTPFEGLGAPPVRNEIPQALQISVINPLANNNFVDLGSQYEDHKVVDKYKMLEERLRVVEGFNVIKRLKNSLSSSIINLTLHIYPYSYN